MISLQQIKYFVSTAEQGSITAAAKELNVTTQAVSRGLIDFERHFETSLFIRRSHCVETTPQGQRLYFKAKSVLDTVDELESCGAELTTPNQDELNLMLCSPPFATKHVVNKHIAAFIKRRFDIEASVTIGYYDACHSALEAGSIDAFITLGHTMLPECDVLPIGTVSTGALVMEFGKLAKKQSVTLEDFRGRPIGLTPEFSFFHDSIVSEYARRGVKVPLAKPEPTLLDTYRVLVREQGCFIVPAIPEFGELFPGAVIRPFSKEDAITVPICLVSRKNGKSPAYLALEFSLVKMIPSIRGIDTLLDS